MEYRIVVETQKSGKDLIFVQFKVFYLFWLYVTQTVSMEGHRQVISFTSLEDAENYITEKANKKYTQSQLKIVKQKIYKTYYV